MQNNKTLGWLLSLVGQNNASLKNELLSDDLLAMQVNDMCLDSREVQPGDVFIALSGFNVHGLDYAYQAERAGAVAVLTEPTKAERTAYVGRQKTLKVPVIECVGLSAMLGEIACEFYGHPSRQLTVTAITGTNGKTSTAWLLMHALELLGVKTGYIGTLGIGGVDQLTTMQNTTPSAIAIQQSLAKMHQSGYQQVCIEVSSHALDQYRFKGTQVQNAIFTNLSRDHLDYHKTMEAYAAAKLKLFKDYQPKCSIINADDAIGKSWLQQELVDSQTISYAVNQVDVDYQANHIRLLPEGIAFDLMSDSQAITFKTTLLGQFNVENVTSVIAVLRTMGYSMKELVPVVKQLQPVPGRMNRIDNNRNGSTMVVDYAHTPDALEQVLKALRAHTNQTLWCVFGCGGNRDKGKRALMGAVAEKLSDIVILTDDNPRFEASSQIIDDIESGMKSKPHVINNRKQAIAYVLDQSQQGDIVLLAGKGHESTQEIDGKLLPFNDMEMVKSLMQVAV